MDAIIALGHQHDASLSYDSQISGWPSGERFAFTRRDAPSYRLLWHPVRVHWASGPTWGSAGGSAAWPAAHVVGIVRVQRLNLLLLGHFLKFGDCQMSDRA